MRRYMFEICYYYAFFYMALLEICRNEAFIAPTIEHWTKDRHGSNV
jgi:hypothetical protein